VEARKFLIIQVYILFICLECSHEQTLFYYEAKAKARNVSNNVVRPLCTLTWWLKLKGCLVYLNEKKMWAEVKAKQIASIFTSTTAMYMTHWNIQYLCMDVHDYILSMRLQNMVENSNYTQKKLDEGDFLFEEA